MAHSASYQDLVRRTALGLLASNSVAETRASDKWSGSCVMLQVYVLVRMRGGRNSYSTCSWLATLLLLLANWVSWPLARVDFLT
jgi:hypothetical protein